MVTTAPYLSFAGESFRSISRKARRDQTVGYGTLVLARLALAALVTISCVLQLNWAAREFVVTPWSEENAMLVASSFMATTVKENASPLARDFSAYRGDVTLVYYWSFGCMACSNVLRDMETVRTRLGAEGLRIVAVNVDDSTYTDALRSEVEYRGYTIDMLQDSRGHSRLIKRAGILPWVLLYDRSGVVRNETHSLIPDRVFSYWLLPVAAREIRELLAAPRPEHAIGPVQNADVRRH